MKNWLEWALSIDASFLYWGGVLDGEASVDDWAWTQFNDDCDFLFDRLHTLERLRIAGYGARRSSPTKVHLDVEFAVLERWGENGGPHERVGHFDLEAVVPPMGGLRWWFLCPVCQRRRAKLYRVAAWPFACRVCADVDYKSHQRHGPAARLGNGWSSLGRFLDRQERRELVLERRAFRRQLSRWKQRSQMQG